MAPGSALSIRIVCVLRLSPDIEMFETCFHTVNEWRCALLEPLVLSSAGAMARTSLN